MAPVSTLVGEDPRIRVARDGAPDPDGRCVLYWMQRSQRAHDNPALNLAIDLGNALELPVLAAFGLTADYPGAHRRHYYFLVEGLVEAARDLQKRGVPLVVRIGRPDDVIVKIAHETRAAIVVGDENPIRVAQQWRTSASDQLSMPMVCVDGDVVIPTSLFPREEYAARTIRPKIHRVWQQYLTPIPNPRARVSWEESETPSGESMGVDSLLRSLKVSGVAEVPGYAGGPREAGRRLKRFLSDRLPGYATGRNQPVPYVTSELSAHLHFGQISPLTIALDVLDSGAPREDIDAYLEELIVRRELAINFVARNPDYDRLAGCPRWGLETLEKHAGDHRQFVYSAGVFEAAQTHDPIWNAAQKEMILSGRMHNYLRMYWAKKLLEWSPDAETAFGIAVDLNDRYEMDGRDPNGYTGIAWAIGGKHDRPWPERPIYGTIRSMTASGLGRKLDVDAYIRMVDGLEHFSNRGQGQDDGIAILSPDSHAP